MDDSKSEDVTPTPRRVVSESQCDQSLINLAKSYLESRAPTNSELPSVVQTAYKLAKRLEELLSPESVRVRHPVLIIQQRAEDLCGYEPDFIDQVARSFKGTALENATVLLVPGEVSIVEQCSTEANQAVDTIEKTRIAESFPPGPLTNRRFF